jgi:hypothetical protein
VVDPSAHEQNQRPGFFFYLIVVAAAFYLLLRLAQGVAWLVEKL